MSNKPTKSKRAKRAEPVQPVFCSIHGALRSICQRADLPCLGMEADDSDDLYFLSIDIDGSDAQAERDELGDPFQPEEPVVDMSEVMLLGQNTYAPLLDW